MECVYHPYYEYVSHGDVYVHVLHVSAYVSVSHGVNAYELQVIM